MMKIALINPPYYYHDIVLHRRISYVYPLNLYILKGEIKDVGGVAVNIIDTNLWIHNDRIDAMALDDAFETNVARKKEYDVYCFTVLSTNLLYVIHWIKLIKRYNSRAIIILGGAAATISGAGLLQRYDEIDCLVIGDGEKKFRDLIKSIQSGIDVKDVDVRGVVTRGNVHMHGGDSHGWMQDVPPFIQRGVPFSRYWSRKEDRVGLIEVGRGCPNECSFCAARIMCGGHVRYKNIDHLVEEIKHVYHNKGVRRFFFLHDNLFVKRKYIYMLAERIIAERMHLRWESNVSLNFLDRMDFELLRKSGCSSIFIGIETLNERIIRDNGLQKLPSVEKVGEVLRKIIDNGIEVSCGFILGFPGESKSDLIENLKRICELRIEIPFGASFCQLAYFPNAAVTKKYWDELVYDGHYPELLQAGVMPDHHRVIIEGDKHSFSPYYSYRRTDYSVRDITRLCGIMVNPLPKTFLRILEDGEIFDGYLSFVTDLCARYGAESDLYQKFYDDSVEYFKMNGCGDIEQQFEDELLSRSM